MTHSELEGTRWERLRRSFRSIPVDGLLVIGYVVVAAAVLYVLGADGVFRAALGLPFALFLPGYALTAALFPMSPEWQSDVDERSSPGLFESGTPGWYERLALSIGLSLALLPLFGFVLATVGGFTQLTVLGSLGGFTVLAMVVAVIRRFQRPRDRRFDVPLETATSDSSRGLFGSETGFDAVLNVVLLLSIVVALSVLGYALVAPQGSAATTDFQLLTEDDSGELVASGYPDELPPGESEELTAAITNEEGEEVTYTVVVEAHRVEEDGTSLEVLERSELARMEATVEDGETVYQDHTVSPAMSGENLRINYYLYRGEAPDDVDAETADEHLWISVDGSGGGDGGGDN